MRNLTQSLQLTPQWEHQKPPNGTFSHCLWKGFKLEGHLWVKSTWGGRRMLTSKAMVFSGETDPGGFPLSQSRRKAQRQTGQHYLTLTEVMLTQGWCRRWKRAFAGWLEDLDVMDVLGAKPWTSGNKTRGKWRDSKDVAITVIEAAVSTE